MADGQQPIPGMNPVSPNPTVPTLDVSPSLVSTGISLMAGGLAQDGTITPEGAQALSQFGQGLAYRMQDRWWRQEFENFRNTRGQQVRMQGQQATQEYNVRLQEAAKITDPDLRMQAMNEVHGWVSEQIGNLSMQYWDMSAEFPNNPYITASANDLWAKMQQQFQMLQAGPQLAAESTKAQQDVLAAPGQRALATAQARGITAEAAGREAQQPFVAEGAQADIELKRAQAANLRREAEGTENPIKRIVGPVANAPRETQLTSMLASKEGAVMLGNLTDDIINDSLQEAANMFTEYQALEAQGDMAGAQAIRKEMLKPTEQGGFGQDIDMLFEAEDKKGAFDDWRAAHYKEFQGHAMDRLLETYNVLTGKPTAAAAERPRPSLLRPGEARGGIQYVEPSAAKREAEVPQPGADANVAIQRYYESRGEAAPKPFDPAVVDQALGNRSLGDVLNVPTKSLSKAERDKEVGDIMEKVRMAVKLPEEKIGRNLLLAAKRYKAATGEDIDPRQLAAIAHEGGKPGDENVTRYHAISADLESINLFLLDPLTSKADKTKLRAKREKLEKEQERLMKSFPEQKSALSDVKAFLKKRSSEQKAGLRRLLE